MVRGDEGGGARIGVRGRGFGMGWGVCIFTGDPRARWSADGSRTMIPYVAMYGGKIMRDVSWFIAWDGVLK